MKAVAALLEGERNIYVYENCSIALYIGVRRAGKGNTVIIVNTVTLGF